MLPPTRRCWWASPEDDDYRPQLPDAQGVLHSRVFPGLRLPVAPLLAGDTAKVLAALTGHEPLNRKPPKTSVNSEDACPNSRPPDRGQASSGGRLPRPVTPSFRAEQSMAGNSHNMY